MSWWNLPLYLINDAVASQKNSLVEKRQIERKSSAHATQYTATLKCAIFKQILNCRKLRNHQIYGFSTQKYDFMSQKHF